MNIQQTLNLMLKQHKEISKNLNTLEDLQLTNTHGQDYGVVYTTQSE